MFKIKTTAAVFTALVSLTGISTAHAEDIPKVTKITLEENGQTYSPGGHFKMAAVALHSEKLGTSQNFGVSHSTFKPGGGADQGKKNGESVYYVIAGELTITTPDGDIILTDNESIYRPAGAEAGIINNSDADVQMLVIYNK